MKKYSLVLTLLVLMANLAIAQISRSPVGRKSVGMQPATQVLEHERPITLETPTNEGGTPVDPNPPPSEFRNVVWVHGWEGSRKSWSVYSRKYGRDVGSDGIFRDGERKMRSFRVDYGDRESTEYAQTVSEAAGIVKRQVAAEGIMPSSQNIFIGHSLGGLTTRQIDKLDGGTNLYGGFITVGTPNKGAIIAKAVMDGKGDQFVNEGIRALVLPFYDTWVGSLLIALSVINDRVHFIKRIFPVIGPAEDLSTTSGLINGLNNGFDHGNKKIIAISARESGVKLWRQLSSIALNPPSKLPLHELGDDELPEKMEKLRGIYNTAGDVSIAISVLHASYLNFYSAGKWIIRSNFFYNGASWISNAPAGWNNLLGANRTEQRTVNTVRVKQSFLDMYNSWQDNRNCEPTPNGGGRTVSCSWTTFLATLSTAQKADMYEPTTTTVSVQIVNENNDGIVLQSSANGIAEGPNVLNLEMELRPDMGVNHQECMNHQFVTDQFEKVFDGLTSRTDKSLDFKRFFTIPNR
jgi:pimeloyl-ACP methyl ester carboxylesterase